MPEGPVMHIIIEKNIEELQKEFQFPKKTNVSKLFEFFCNYCATSKHYLGRFNPKDITTDEDDASIDGISIIIDGDLITTFDDATNVFAKHKTNLSVEVIFTQCKSGEAFKKADINNFSVGVEDFLSLKPKYPQGKLNVSALKIFNVILKNLKKVKNRLPTFHAYYCTSGNYSDERELQASFEALKRKVIGTELFYEAHVTPMGRAELLKFYASATETNEATLKLIDYFGMPKIPNIPQSYIGIANALDFVENVISDNEGNLNHRVFEENIRSYLGATNIVNGKIQATLEDINKKDLFSVLNNGITIVTPELTLTPNTREISLTNYQVINGCQTSNTLFHNKHLLTDSVNVIIKFIESANSDVSEDIISATNNQTEVHTESFHGLKNKAKLVQRYFDAKNDKAAAENKIYFERREQEYKTSGFQNTRIFDVRELARCYAALVLNQPHNSARYVKEIFSSSGADLFCDADHESLYYASALALYKYNTLVNGRKNGAHNFIKLRWHVVQVYKWVVHGKTEMPAPSSKAAEAYANQIISSLLSEDKAYIDKFQICQEIITAAGAPTSDAIKRGKFTAELIQKANEYFMAK
jgi:hypothetical protein